MAAVSTEMNKTLCVVLTDLEPDDMLALAILTSRDDLRVPLIVAGEGNPLTKLQRLLTYERLGLFQAVDTYTKLMQGCDSSKLFPGETAVPEPNTCFDANAFLLELESIIAATCNVAISRPFLVVLKPPRELCACLDAFPERAAALFCQFNCALYGSYNIRCMNGAADWMLDASKHAFARMVLYESTRVGKLTPMLQQHGSEMMCAVKRCADVLVNSLLQQTPCLLRCCATLRLMHGLNLLLGRARQVRHIP